MRSLSVGVLAVVTMFCITPVSIRGSHGNGMTSLSAVFDRADAAELNLPVRHRSAIRHGRSVAYASRTYDFYCDGPYVGGGWNGGTYYGGPWIDLRCYGGVY
jgi:hypothetical protein